MQRGYTMLELAVVAGVVGVVMSITLPHFGYLLDRIAVERAATELTTALAVTRNRAVLRSTRARLVLSGDSLRIDEWADQGWQPALRWLGPDQHQVNINTSNATVTFDAHGIGLGVANTRVELWRGSQSATITMSRVGRVKRW